MARLVALVIAFLAMLVLSRGQAWPHASLTRSEPPDGAVLAQPPAALTLTFNEPVAPLIMRLIGPFGRSIALPSVVADGATIRVDGLPSLASGTHVLSWRVVSADGHPVGGSLIFSIGAPSAHAPEAAPDAAQRSVAAVLWVTKAALYLGLFIGVGGAFFRAWIAEQPLHTSAIPIAALLTGVIASVLSIGAQGLDALDLPLAAAQERAAWQAGLATAYGPTAIVAALSLLAALLAFAGGPGIVSRGLSLAALLGTGLALSLSGHAGTAAPELISRPTLFLHVVCVTFWIGSLLPLYAGVRTGFAGKEFDRFSRAITLAIALLAASGLWLVVAQLDRPDALWTTSYGQVLAAKLALVAALLVLGAANRYVWVPRLQRRGAAAARPLAISIGVEIGVAVAVLGLVALWRFTPPPRALVAAAPTGLHLHGEKAMVQIEFEPSRGKPAGVRLLLFDGQFRPLVVQAVTLVLANPAAGIEAMRHAARPAGDSTWQLEELRIPMGGPWRLQVEVLITDFDKVTLEDTVTLPRLP
jgi:copper transport protein